MGAAASAVSWTDHQACRQARSLEEKVRWCGGTDCTGIARFIIVCRLPAAFPHVLQSHVMSNMLGYYWLL